VGKLLLASCDLIGRDTFASEFPIEKGAVKAGNYAIAKSNLMLSQQPFQCYKKIRNHAIDSPINPTNQSRPLLLLMRQ
jgi:hypothetical protein